VKKYYFNLAIWKIGIFGVGRYILGIHMRGKRSSIGAYGLDKCRNKLLIQQFLTSGSTFVIISHLSPSQKKFLMNSGNFPFVCV